MLLQCYAFVSVCMSLYVGMKFCCFFNMLYKSYPFAHTDALVHRHGPYNPSPQGNSTKYFNFCVCLRLSLGLVVISRRAVR